MRATSYKWPTSESPARGDRSGQAQRPKSHHRPSLWLWGRHMKRSRRWPTILDACRDPNLFAPWFRNYDTWAVWQVFLAALFALQ
jgi:hypothetical protein